jgi:hypothetical protein
MPTKAELAQPTLIEGWLRDLSLTPTLRNDGGSNWNLEFTVQAPAPLIMNAVNPKAIPRAVMIVCGMSIAPEHATIYNTLDDARRRLFWAQLRQLMTREYIEFQIEGAPVAECPKAIRVSAMRFDDGLTLDSFARSISSVCKACTDAVVHITDNLGQPAAAAGGEFSFKKTVAQ